MHLSFFMVRTFKDLSSGYYVTYNTLLLTIITLLCKKNKKVGIIEMENGIGNCF